MSLLDWELPEERRALNDMCARATASLPQTLVDAGIPWIGMQSQLVAQEVTSLTQL